MTLLGYPWFDELGVCFYAERRAVWSFVGVLGGGFLVLRLVESLGGWKKCKGGILLVDSGFVGIFGCLM